MGLVQLILVSRGPKAKITFPEFGDTYPRARIRNCERFFAPYSMANEVKMSYVSMNIKEQVDNWFDNNFLDKRAWVTWPMFCLDICLRFGNIRPTEIFKEFMLCQQVTNVESYQRKFEELRCLMG